MKNQKSQLDKGIDAGFFAGSIGPQALSWWKLRLGPRILALRLAAAATRTPIKPFRRGGCEQTLTPISLAGSQLDSVRHVCALFNSDEEEYRVLLPFIKDGFDCGDKAVHVVNPEQQGNHLERLSAAGIDAAMAQKRGQFELRANTDTYLRDGRFDQHRMLAVFEELANHSVESGFAMSRIVCRMDWAADGHTHLDNLIEFESRVNEVWRRHDDAVICTYHLGHFSGDTVIDIMRTHPLVILGGILHKNPFFVPPEQFLPEFRERQARQAARRHRV
jgi:MEDS: MEthanogen/methylotroph, DcmR Sensory domain